MIAEITSVDTLSKSRRAEFVLITPKMAKEWLEKFNISNRKLRERWSMTLSESIKRGEWVTTHQGIAFDESGNLIDGQHRLRAIINSGIAVEMLVVTNISNQAYKVLDCGIKRTISDRTNINQKTTEVLSLAASIVFAKNTGATTSDQVINIANTGLLDASEELMEHCCNTAKYYSSAPMRLAACVRILEGVSDKNYIKNVYRGLILQDFDSLPKIAHGLIRQVSKTNRAKVTRDDILTRGLRVFDQKNESLAHIRASDGAWAYDVIRRVLEPLLANN